MEIVKPANSPCNVWLHCDTCVKNLIECATCPGNRIGPACLQVRHIRRKRHHVVWNPRKQYVVSNHRRQYVVSNPKGRNMVSNTRIQNVVSNTGMSKRSVSCSDLESPKPGSVSCRFSNIFKSCTGTCAPGYSFSTSGQQQMTLECRGGTWTPHTIFPNCISGGQCDLEVKSAGKIKCNTDLMGTLCDVSCNGMYSRQYHCYPGIGWAPGLPPCVQPKGIISQPSRLSCFCQNNGQCDSNGRCVCPNGWAGSNCEQRVQRPSCPDPGIPNGSERTTDDGNSANLPRRRFDVGIGLIFSCTGTGILQGTSMIWCEEEGQWSASAPKCVREVERPSCPDPGIPKESRRTTDDGTPANDPRRFDVGEELKFSCTGTGYELQGTSMIWCRKAGTWSSPTPQCVKRIEEPSCPDPGIPNGSQRTTDDGTPANELRSFDVGEGLMFSCMGIGYELEGMSMIYCKRGGKWSAPSPKCVTVTPVERACRRPRPDRNGFIEANSPTMPRYTPGTRLTFGCREGYRPVGPIMLYCLTTGGWSSSPPTCEETVGGEPGSGPEHNCKRVPSVPGASFVVTADPTSDDDEPREDDPEFPPRTRVHYTCRGNQITRGSDSLVCLPTGYWDPEEPVCVEDCGRSQLEPTHHVSNGNNTTPGDWPWTVAIAETVGNNTFVVCGGALISNGTVLTAAHCVDKYPSYTLYFGKYYRKNDNDDDKVVKRITTEIILHESYDNVTYENDIALLFFEPRVSYNNRIKPVCLPTPKETEKNLVPLTNLGSVAGWGYNEKNLRSDRLMVAQLLVQPNQECLDSFIEHGIHRAILPGMFCAGYRQGVVSACTGDSGSPLVFLNPTTHRQTIEGLVSFGLDSRRVRCGTERVYSVFTKVAHYMTWILKHWRFA